MVRITSATISIKYLDNNFFNLQAQGSLKLLCCILDLLRFQGRNRIYKMN